jgi:rare lipoprotein A
MARAAFRHIVLLTSALALGACVEGGTTTATTAGGDAPAKAQKSTRLVDRDVEAPEVFQVTEQALWDGRPSLGGVWVASPDAEDPERVIMRNPANGKFVIGALFRRERDNPGPKLQISSDAAVALGILAGAPGNISVTALRREEAEAEAPTSPILDSAETLDTADAAAPGAIDAGGVETKPLDGPAPATAPKAGKKASDTAAVAGAAIAAAEGTAPAANAAPAAPANPPAATGGRPIQIGIFSVEANAERAVDTLAKAGVPADIRSETAKGKSFWSVIARGDAATLKKIKSAGFADAYMLK